MVKKKEKLSVEVVIEIHLFVAVVLGGTAVNCCELKENSELSSLHSPGLYHTCPVCSFSTDQPFSRPRLLFCISDDLSVFSL